MLAERDGGQEGGVIGRLRRGLVRKGWAEEEEKEAVCRLARRWAGRRREMTSSRRVRLEWWQLRERSRLRVDDRRHFRSR